MARELDGFRISGVHVPQYTDARIASHHAFQTTRRLFGAIVYRHLSGVLRIADAYAAAVVYRDPTRARRCVEQRIQNGPIGDRVALIEHVFGFAIRRSDRAAIQMVAAD